VRSLFVAAALDIDDDRSFPTRSTPLLKHAQQGTCVSWGSSRFIQKDGPPSADRTGEASLERSGNAPFSCPNSSDAINDCGSRRN